MRSTTPTEALGRALHFLRDEGHDCDWQRCPVLAMDTREAEDVVDALAAIGWMVAPTVSLPDRAPSRGPRTCDVAAASIDGLNDRQWAVWWVVGLYGDLTDAELVDRYDGTREQFNLPAQSPSSLRTRRAELVRAGHVYDTGRTRATKAGRPAVCWAARGERTQAVAS